MAANRFGAYEDRYSASVAGAQAVLDGSTSYGKFLSVDDARSDLDETRSEYSESAFSPSDAGTSRAEPQQLQVPPRRVKTSEDAARMQQANSVRNCGCGAPFRNYSSVFTYVVGFGWLLDVLGANQAPPENFRIRRSMSSRIAVDAGNEED